MNLNKVKEFVEVHFSKLLTARSEFGKINRMKRDKISPQGIWKEEIECRKAAAIRADWLVNDVLAKAEEKFQRERTERAIQNLTSEAQSTGTTQS